MCTHPPPPPPPPPNLIPKSLTATRGSSRGEAPTHRAARNTAGAVSNRLAARADGVDAITGVVASGGDEDERAGRGACFYQVSVSKLQVLYLEREREREEKPLTLERVNERVSADTAVGRASSLSTSHEGSSGGKKGKELGHFEDLVGFGFGWKRWLLLMLC